MEHYKNDEGVVFGDVNLREGRVTQSRDGTPQNPGAGGWPTLRYYNADTGPGGAPVERITNQKICDEFKIPQRMIDSVTTSRKVCDAVTKAGCDDDEVEYLDAWRGDAAARDAEAARLDDLLSDATQKKMKAERKRKSRFANSGSGAYGQAGSRLPRGTAGARWRAP